MTQPYKLMIEHVKARLAPLLVSEMPYVGGKLYPTESHLTEIAEAAIVAVNSYKDSEAFESKEYHELIQTLHIHDKLNPPKT